MSEQEYCNLIQGHAHLQRRAQPFLKVIHDANEEIPQARLRAASLHQRPKYTPNTRGAFASPDTIDEVYRRLARLIAEQESSIAEVCKMIAPQAQKSCRSLCDRIYHDLPREIRDSIYGFLHAHDTIYVGPAYFGQNKQPCETDRDAHYWDADFVGKDVQREMIESWYRTTLFYFYDKHHNTEVVTKFLDTDRWQLGIKPRHFICKTRFELDASHSLVTMRIQDRRTHTTRGIQPLENLHLLPNHVSFLIRIHTYGDVEANNSTSECLRSTVDDLHRSLNALHLAGHKFIVRWPDYEDLEFNRGDCALSVEAWLERLEAVGKRMLQNKLLGNGETH